MVLRELLLEDEHVVHVREYPVEVGGEERGFDFMAHLLVASLIHLLDLELSD